MRIRSASSLLILTATLAAANLSAQEGSQRAWLGVVVEGSANGPAKIVEVDKNSPAAKAGLAVGDLILRFGDAPAGNVDSFIRKIQGAKAGGKVVLTVRRGAGTRRIPVVLGSQGDAARAKAEASKSKNEEAKAATERAKREIEAKLAKQKAKVEAEVAKRKAKAEAEVAKRKAKVEAEIAKRKAEIEAKMAQRKAEAAAAIAERKAQIAAEQKRADAAAKQKVADAAKAARAPSQGRRAFMGVTIELGERGARIGQVTAGSGAQSARLRSGDVIVEAAGKAVRTREDLVQAIQARKPGDKLPLVVLRDGKRVRKDVVLGAVGGASVAAAQAPRDARGELDRARAALQRARDTRNVELRDGAWVPSAWTSELAAAKRRARAEGKPLLIDFTAKWSGPCRMLAKNFSKAEVEKATRGFVCVRVDVDKHESIADDYGVNSIPHVVLLSPEGKQLQKFTGYLGAKDLAARMTSWGAKAAPAAGRKHIGEDWPAKASRGKAPAAGKEGSAKAGEIEELRTQVRSLVDAQKRMRAQLDRLIELIGRKNGKK